VIHSDDGGQTWQAGAAVQGQTDEAQAIEWADGTLMLNMRSNRGRWCRYVALSRGGGETWFREFDEPALPETQCQASLLRVLLPAPDGERPGVLFANPAHPGPWDARANLTVRLGWDEGQTWPIARQVTAGPAAYSCLAPLRDGTIGLLYESGREHPYEKITFARFNAAWLTRLVVPPSGSPPRWQEGVPLRPKRWPAGHGFFRRRGAASRASRLAGRGASAGFPGTPGASASAPSVADPGAAPTDRAAGPAARGGQGWGHSGLGLRPAAQQISLTGPSKNRPPRPGLLAQAYHCIPPIWFTQSCGGRIPETGGEWKG